MSATQFDQVFERWAAQLPATVRTARAQSLARFSAQGWPHRKLEDWRYTDLSALADKQFATPSSLPDIDIAGLLLDGCDTHLCINGGDGALKTHGSEGSSVVALNAAFAREGLQLHLPADQTAARPVHLLTYVDSAQPVMAHLRHAIKLDANAQATVILQHAGRGDYLTTQVTDIELGPGAQLTLYRFQDEAAGSTHLAQTDVRMARDSRLHFVNADLGEGLARLDFNVQLDGAGAEAALHGLYALNDRAHADAHLRIHHRAGHCNSRIAFRGIADGSAHAVLNARVMVHEHAIKTDSETRIANLLLSKSAEVYAKPELEIYNDDVKCAHGATFGQLDPDAIYYLRARGLDSEMARALLTRAFVTEVLEHVGHDALRQRIHRRLLQKLPQGSALESLS
ncbi:MAG TPA: Fe-S cluster assembly protein SufD [Stenotrophobium sp.]|nr:Fe-S cluster assembly protein SufD [Stenotrophobium sp.]